MLGLQPNPRGLAPEERKMACVAMSFLIFGLFLTLGLIVTLPALYGAFVKHVQDACTITGHRRGDTIDVYTCTSDNWTDANAAGYAIAGLVLSAISILTGGQLKPKVNTMGELAVQFAVTLLFQFYFSAMVILFIILTVMASKKPETVHMNSVGILFHGFDLGAWTIAWTLLILLFQLSIMGIVIVTSCKTIVCSSASSARGGAPVVANPYGMRAGNAAARTV